MNKLAMRILEYESDTFSANGTNLTKPELKLIWKRLEMRALKLAQNVLPLRIALISCYNNEKD